VRNNSYPRLYFNQHGDTSRRHPTIAMHTAIQVVPAVVVAEVYMYRLPPIQPTLRAKIEKASRRHNTNTVQHSRSVHLAPMSQMPPINLQTFAHELVSGLSRFLLGNCMVRCLAAIPACPLFARSVATIASLSASGKPRDKLSRSPPRLPPLSLRDFEVCRPGSICSVFFFSQ
jgi:hypothetical protein